MSRKNLHAFRSICVIQSALILAWFLSTASAVSTDSNNVTVSQTDDVFYVRMVLDIKAPAQRVLEILIDYAHIHDITPEVMSSEVLPAPAAGITRVRTTMRDCFAVFCKTIRLVEDIQSNEHGLTATVIPSMSDMKSGASEWQITAIDDATRIVFESRMEPGFWIPPIVGSRLIRSILEKRAAETGRNLENRARKATAPAQQLEYESPPIGASTH